METIHSGWLTKSPPDWKAGGLRWFKSKWRLRYFVLYVPPVISGCLRGADGCSALLCYYDNERMEQERGKIDLGRCNELVTHLASEEFSFMFALHLLSKSGVSRTYFLAADTQDDMDGWTECLYGVLKMYGSCDEINVLSAPHEPKKNPRSVYHRHRKQAAAVVAAAAAAAAGGGSTNVHPLVGYSPSSPTGLSTLPRRKSIFNHPTSPLSKIPSKVSRSTDALSSVGRSKTLKASDKEQMFECPDSPGPLLAPRGIGIRSSLRNLFFKRRPSSPAIMLSSHPEQPSLTSRRRQRRGSTSNNSALPTLKCPATAVASSSRSRLPSDSSSRPNSEVMDLDMGGGGGASSDDSNSLWSCRAGSLDENLQQEPPAASSPAPPALPRRPTDLPHINCVPATPRVVADVAGRRAPLKIDIGAAQCSMLFSPELIIKPMSDDSEGEGEDIDSDYDHPATWATGLHVAGSEYGSRTSDDNSEEGLDDNYDVPPCFLPPLPDTDPQQLQQKQRRPPLRCLLSAVAEQADLSAAHDVSPNTRTLQRGSNYDDSDLYDFPPCQQQQQATLRRSAAGGGADVAAAQRCTNDSGFVGVDDLADFRRSRQDPDDLYDYLLPRTMDDFGGGVEAGPMSPSTAYQQQLQQQFQRQSSYSDDTSCGTGAASGGVLEDLYDYIPRRRSHSVGDEDLDAAAAAAAAAAASGGDDDDDDDDVYDYPPQPVLLESPLCAAAASKTEMTSGQTSTRLSGTPQDAFSLDDNDIYDYPPLRMQSLNEAADTPNDEISPKDTGDTHRAEEPPAAAAAAAGSGSGEDENSFNSEDCGTLKRTDFHPHPPDVKDAADVTLKAESTTSDAPEFVTSPVSVTSPNSARNKLVNNADSGVPASPCSPRVTSPSSDDRCHVIRFTPNSCSFKRRTPGTRRARVNSQASLSPVSHDVILEIDVDKIVDVSAGGVNVDGADSTAGLAAVTTGQRNRRPAVPSKSKSCRLPPREDYAATVSDDGGSGRRSLSASRSVQTRGSAAASGDGGGRKAGKGAALFLSQKRVLAELEAEMEKRRTRTSTMVVAADNDGGAGADDDVSADVIAAPGDVAGSAAVAELAAEQ